jgi:hypothetical protein
MAPLRGISDIVPSRIRLWYGVAVPPLAWAAALLVGYGGAGNGCRSPSVAPGSMIIAGAIWPVLAVFVLTMLTGGALATSARSVKVLARQRRRTVADPAATVELYQDRAWFMAVTGLGASVLFLFGIMAFVVPQLFINACALRR